MAEALKRVNPEIATDCDSFYAELTSRNRHFVTSRLQEAVRNLKILIAGCGSTGGACTQSLARLGVIRFALADSGEYELNNLNRQHAFLGDLGKNKASFHAAAIREINPFAELIVRTEGITEENAEELCGWADLVMDAVDVTTHSGIQAKLSLHEAAQRLARPVFTALDLGFCQWGESFDYRDRSIRTLKGRLEAARKARHPMKALFTIAPLAAVPAHALPMIEELIRSPDTPASQLGGTSDLLSSVIVSAVLRFADDGHLVPGWNIDLAALARSPAQRLGDQLKAWSLRRRIRGMLRKTD